MKGKRIILAAALSLQVTLASAQALPVSPIALNPIVQSPTLALSTKTLENMPLLTTAAAEKTHAITMGQLLQSTWTDFWSQQNLLTSLTNLATLESSLQTALSTNDWISGAYDIASIVGSPAVTKAYRSYKNLIGTVGMANGLYRQLAGSGIYSAADLANTVKTTALLADAAYANWDFLYQMMGTKGLSAGERLKYFEEMAVKCNAVSELLRLNYVDMIRKTEDMRNAAVTAAMLRDAIYPQLDVNTPGLKSLNENWSTKYKVKQDVLDRISSGNASSKDYDNLVIEEEREVKSLDETASWLQKHGKLLLNVVTYLVLVILIAMTAINLGHYWKGDKQRADALMKIPLYGGITIFLLELIKTLLY